MALDTPQDHVLLPIILDGENPWEHYQEGGEQFLSHLYQALSDGVLNEGDSIRVATATISNALEPHRIGRISLICIRAHGSTRILRSGSATQKTTAGWDLLSHTRSRLLEISSTLPPDRAKAAWQELYAAEGSDWFWWYGDDFDTTYKEEFDWLFRMHLRNVWTLAGMTPPAQLNQPLCEIRRFEGRDQVTMPLAILHPTLDGVVTDFFEWRGAGTINPNPPLGAMWKAEGLFTAIFFVCDFEHLYLRLDPDEAFKSRTSDLRIECVLQAPRGSYRLMVSSASPDRYRLARRRDDGSWEDIGSWELIGWNYVLELALPFKEIQVGEGRTDADEPPRV